MGLLRKPQLLTGLLVAFVLLDLLYSGSQHYRFPLDGDLAPIVVPNASYRPVLQDPFGLAVLLRGEVYPAPNRYFTHALMHGYFRQVPLWLQALVPPISSVYLACALFKTLTQALLVYVLATYASRTGDLRRRGFWVAAALLTPFFQTRGYGIQMAVIDPSITYTCFYAFPLALLLLFLLPFYRRAGGHARLSALQTIALLALAVVLAFNGTVVTGVVAVLIPGIIVAWARPRLGMSGEQPLPGRLGQLIARAPRREMLVGGVLGLLCLYSLFIGRNNSENLWATRSLPERFALLPVGVYKVLTLRLGLPLLLLALLGNAYLIRRHGAATAEGQWWLSAIRWLGWFSLAYVLLLPLGGYRSYRPYIVRYDTIMPITLALMTLFAATTWYLLRHLPRRRLWYGAGLAAMGLIYQLVDKPLPPLADNRCERQAMQRLAEATEPVVALPGSCLVLAWRPITDPGESLVNAQLLEQWRITAGRRLYYNAGE